MIACREVNNAKHLGLQSPYAIDNQLDVSTGKVSDPESLLFYVGFDTPG